MKRVMYLCLAFKIILQVTKVMQIKITNLYWCFTFYHDHCL